MIEERVNKCAVLDRSFWKVMLEISTLISSVACVSKNHADENADVEEEADGDGA